MLDFEKNSISSVIKYERAKYYSNYFDYLMHRIMNAELSQIWRFQFFLRKAEYHKFKKHRLRFAYFLLRKNSLGNKLGFSIHCGNFDIGLKLCHIGCIIVNGDARVGKECTLHGNNCIGNKSDNNVLVPVIGDNFSLGFSSVVYGGITICNDVTISAMSLVNKNISNSGVFAGIPIELKKVI